jgi:hypothetical protein
MSEKSKLVRIQKSVCSRFQTKFVESKNELKVGIALQTLGQTPLNALRHPIEGDTTGWYIWAGEQMSEEVNFFQPLHVEHLSNYVPELLPYLGLAPGWRVLLANSHEDVWYDENLLK